MMVKNIVLKEVKDQKVWDYYVTGVVCYHEYNELYSLSLLQLLSNLHQVFQSSHHS